MPEQGASDIQSQERKPMAEAISFRQIIEQPEQPMHYKGLVITHVPSYPRMLRILDGDKQLSQLVWFNKPNLAQRAADEYRRVNPEKTKKTTKASV
jgi:hypothetical protein